MRRALPLLCAAGLAACGGGGEEAERAPTPRAATSPDAGPPPGPGVGRARTVITGWADALRRSDVERAVEFFAVPLVVSQGRAVRLTTRRAVRTFNAGLPCGSRVTGVARQERYFVATFRLTERPGQRCDGPGSTARVAFKLRGDRIREWRQLVERTDQALPPATEAS